jgi:hypothetical protein
MHMPPQREKHPNKVRVVHPFLFAIFPILAITSGNLVWIHPHEVLLPLVSVLVLAGALWLLLCPVLPQPYPRGLVISLLWLPFYCYGFAVDTLRHLFSFDAQLGLAQLSLVFLVALSSIFCVGLWLRKKSWSFRILTVLLNNFALAATLVSVLATSLNLYQIHATTLHGITRENAPKSESENADLPDIYYIILDSYARSDHLLKFFGYDDRPFLDGLRERGFYIAEKSFSNYPCTLPSLSSTLNLGYHDNAIAPEGWSNDIPGLFSKFRKNIVMDFLKERGYELVTFASGFPATQAPVSDRWIAPKTHRLSEFQRMLINFTPIRSVFNQFKPQRWHFRAPFVLRELGKVKRNAERQPMFVFAHILAPHVPHVYDADGHILAEELPIIEGWQASTAMVGKLGMKAVDRILKGQSNAIIIIQGDHGPLVGWNGMNPEFTFSWDEFVLDSTAILNAYYYPDQGYEDMLYPEITPVNTFRLLFNRVFGTDYELLEDVTHLSPQFSDGIVSIPHPR